MLHSTFNSGSLSILYALLCSVVAYYQPTLIAVGEIINDGDLFASWHGRSDPDAAAAAEDNLELARMVAVQLGSPCPATAS